MSSFLDGARQAERGSDSGLTDNPVGATQSLHAGSQELGGPVALTYAPPAKDPRRIGYAVVAGVVTTVVTHVVVWLLNRRAGINVMGWYPRLLPLGAAVVGLAAASGFAAACRWWGIKVTRRFVAAVLVAQACSYAGAQYLEFAAAGPLVYRATNRPVGFLDYYHLRTMGFTWGGSSFGAGSRPVPIGGWGYVVRTAEVGGFVLGGLIPVGMVVQAGYCDLCQRYMKRKRLAVLPGSVAVRSVSRRNAAAFAAHYAEHEQAWSAGQQTLAEWQRLATGDDADAFAREVDRFRPGSRKANRLPRRIHVHLAYCPNCRSGVLQPSVVTLNNHAKEDVVKLPPVPLRPEFVRRVAA